MVPRPIPSFNQNHGTMAGDLFDKLCLAHPGICSPHLNFAAIPLIPLEHMCSKVDMVGALWSQYLPKCWFCTASSLARHLPSALRANQFFVTLCPCPL